MKFLRTWLLGIKSLLLHPMRSLLTILGIFIGVASVIWLLAIGEGISIEARRQIEGLGADNIIVRSIKPPSEKTAGNSGPTPYGLKRAEYDLLVETIPTIQSALPIREIRRQFRYRGRLVDPQSRAEGLGCRGAEEKRSRGERFPSAPRLLCPSAPRLLPQPSSLGSLTARPQHGA